ncbi:CaiB/BaiF CoA transferase family protein [Jannaschia donghaensis]|uniref:Formyl-coenzyme A transferase n=1 Tax=Jannaschia donghaensis TaxID=420998 RepID=A0A0M6YD99_9RHOB|nr:CoA transferase [Jannaschia donghaensis]CTQ48318.1 Formyl-coenzyme A transferase [Jannaschia donghaensis]
MTGPLAGLRVIDFTHVLAGPACAYHLGLMGAEVIKVESPRGDAMRHRSGSDPARAARGMSTAYATQAAGKRVVVLDLDTPDGRAQMEDQLASADVLVENHRPETLDRLGLGWDGVHKRHPHIVHCAMTGYGRGHRLENAPAYDVNIQAASGLMAMTGTAATGPMRVGAPVIDYATALAAGFGICAALVERARTGRGRLVDVAMMDVALTLMSSTIVDHALTGNVPRPRGNAANSRSPSSGLFPCAEGHLSLGVNEASQFARLARVLGRGEWLEDARFGDPNARQINADALSTAIADRLLTRTAAEWEGDMLAAGVPAARLRTPAEAVAAARADDRPFLMDAGGAPTPAPPFRIGPLPQSLAPPQDLPRWPGPGDIA